MNNNTNKTNLFRLIKRIMCVLIIGITIVLVIYNKNSRYDGEIWEDTSFHINILNNYDDNKKIISSYKEYVTLMNKMDISINQYNKDFFNNHSLVFIEIIEQCHHMETVIKSVKENGTNIDIEIYKQCKGNTADINFYSCLIPISKNVENVNINYVSESTYEYEIWYGGMVIYCATICFLFTFLKEKYRKVVLIISVSIFIFMSLYLLAKTYNLC